MFESAFNTVLSLEMNLDSHKKPHPYLGNELTELLRRLRKQCQKSQAQIAADAWISESYVSRLLSGERSRPDRDVLILLALKGLDLDVPPTEEVLFAAGYRSLVRAEYSV